MAVNRIFEFLNDSHLKVIQYNLALWLSGA